MVLSEQAMRNWKVATYVCTFGTAFFTIFYTPYTMPPHLEGRKHVLTDVQESYHKMIDKYVWGLPPKGAIVQKEATTNGEEKR
mmetsp:Transcript_19113/g.31673  ORF Transcript_19113/g.31673 Transcript_19113/m.31673 type:complete len:83 (-) Transcript_19113:139-387(-)